MGWALNLNNREHEQHISFDFSNGEFTIAPKRSDIQRCVNISIHIVSAVIALKVFVGSFSKMFYTHYRFDLYIEGQQPQQELRRAPFVLQKKSEVDQTTIYQVLF
jgi:hypothetical protein